MGKLHRIVTKVHRVCAGLLLLAMVPAGYAAATGDEESLLILLPLPFLFGLILTGIYQLVLPWVRKARARKASQGSS